MLDLKMIRNHVEDVKAKLATRGVEPEAIDDLLAKDNERRELIVKSENLKKLRNEVSDQISQLKRNKEDANDKIQEMRKVSQDIKGLDEQLENIAEEVESKAAHLPNLPHEDVPVSLTEEGSVEQRRNGTPRTFDFTPKAHWEIGEELGILDFERAAKVAGSRFVYYVGDGARLERAVYN